VKPYVLLIFSLLSLLSIQAEGLSDPKPLSVYQILQKNAEVMGGWFSWEQIESFQQNGTLHRDNIDVNYVSVRKRPNNIRMTLTLPPASESSDAIQIIRAYNGDKAWSATRTVGQMKTTPTLLDSESTKAMHNDASILPVLMRLSKSDAKFELTNTITNETGITFYQLTASTKEAGQTYALYVSAETFLLERYEELKDGVVLASVEQSNFQSLASGVKIPHTILITAQTTSTTRIEIEHTEIGVGIYDEYFEIKPEAVANSETSNGS
jgi:outer membrane lipoprotein-sorting protein